MKKNNLIETMESLPSDAKCKVGTETGSCFFFIGTVGEFLDNLDKIDELAKAFLERRLKVARKNLLTMANAPMNLETYVKAEYNKLQYDTMPDFSLEGFHKARAEYLKKLQNRANYVMDCDRAIDLRVPLERREVVNISRSDKLIGDGIIIIIEGDEAGRWWDHTEQKEGELYGFGQGND